MAIAVGATSKGRTIAGTTQATTGVTTQASGSTFLVAAIWKNSATFTSLVDSKSNVYTQIGSDVTNVGGDHTRVYYCQNGVGGASHTATITINASVGLTVFFLEVTGGLLTGILDQQNGRDDNASPYTLAAGLTTTQAAELLVSFIGGNSGSNPATHAETGMGSSTVQAGANETDGTQFFTGALATSIKSATGTFNPSWTESGASDALVWLVTFKEAPASGGARLSKSRGTRGPQRFRKPTLATSDFTPSGVLVGSSSFAFTATGTLTGDGALTGTAALTFTPTATLRGDAPITGPSSFAFNPTGTLIGIGALTGASTVTFSPSATLTGSGALAGSTTLAFSPTATLTGSGALSGSATITFSLSGTLTDAAGGAGALTGSSSITFTAVGALTGTGALSGATTLTFSPVGTLSDAAAPPVVVVTQTPAGSQRKRRQYVEIDGQTFPVDNASQALALLQQARALAERQAEVSAEKVVKRLRKKAAVPAVVIPAPVITASAELDLSVEIRAIEAIYTRAAQTAEIRLLLEKQQADEDDDETTVLLLIS